MYTIMAGLRAGGLLYLLVARSDSVIAGDLREVGAEGYTVLMFIMEFQRCVVPQNSPDHRCTPANPVVLLLHSDSLRAFDFGHVTCDPTYQSYSDKKSHSPVYPLLHSDVLGKSTHSYTPNVPACCSTAR